MIQLNAHDYRLRLLNVRNDKGMVANINKFLRKVQKFKSLDHNENRSRPIRYKTWASGISDTIDNVVLRAENRIYFYRRTYS